jgi:RNA polymerase sigma-70 factor (ECF subfamily)
VDEVQHRVRIERLFSAHVAAVRAYARRRVESSAADDAVSEVFVIAWRRLDDVPEDALPWLLGCARLVLGHQQRRDRRDAALVERLRGVAHVASSTFTVHDDDALGRALAQLRDRDRELLLLIAWEGLEPAQAAKVLGCSRNALDTRLHRARKRLAAALARAERGLHPDEPRRPVKEAL